MFADEGDSPSFTPPISRLVVRNPEVFFLCCFLPLCLFVFTQGKKVASCTRGKWTVRLDVTRMRVGWVPLW